VRRRRSWLAGGALLLAAAGAAAQQAGREGAPGARPAEREPVTFTAGELVFDERTNTVIASGGVEAWQGDRVLRAREIRFDRNTNRITASGDVALVEADGRVLFAETAELTDDLREGVARNIRALLAEGGRFAATGARRSEGRFTELRRGVYSTCEPCATDPERPPLWQIRADRVLHDEQRKTVEYFDATMQIAGVPVAWVPYFWHADPSVRRQSGFLFPDFGSSRHLGVFFRQPYYWVISPQADATIAPMVTTRQNVPLFAEYRHRFNSGFLAVRGSGNIERDGEARGAVFSTGRFSVNDTWRAGWTLERTSDNAYLRQYRVGSTDSTAVLVTTPFFEGFGRNFYARADSFLFQGLQNPASSRFVPVVLPRLHVEYFGEHDHFGGQFRIDGGVFAASRRDGTDTQRLVSRANYRLPLAGPIGDLWTFEGNLDLIGYNVGGNPLATPLIGGREGARGRAHPQLAATWRWPLMRVGWGGAQLIEPILQGIVAPNVGRSQLQYPNEDSVDLEFSASNLFRLNRFPGIDRLEGGVRLNAGLRAAYYIGGASIDALIGQSFRVRDAREFPRGSGLDGRRSDYVARLTVSPNDYLSLTYSGRFDSDDLSSALTDITTTLQYAGRYLSLSYFDAPAQPLANQPLARREIAGGLGGRLFGFWSGAIGARRDLEDDKMVASYGLLAYEDECFAFQAVFTRRFSSTFASGRGSALVFRLVFRTVGDFGFSAF
jgi:LPS-assembly protein